MTYPFLVRYTLPAEERVSFKQGVDVFDKLGNGLAVSDRSIFESPGGEKTYGKRASKKPQFILFCTYIMTTIQGTGSQIELYINKYACKRQSEEIRVHGDFVQMFNQSSICLAVPT